MRSGAAAAAGLAAGLVAGLLGIGGGLVIVPILHLLLAVPLKRAVGTSLAGVVAISAVAVLTEIVVAPANLHVLPALALAAGAVVGSLIGVRIVAALPAAVLARLLAVVLLIAAARMAGIASLFLPATEAGPVTELAAGGAAVALHVAGGVAAGIISALFGVGGGILAVPLLALFHPAWAFQACRATSLLMIVPTSIIGALLHRRAQQLDRAIAGRLVPGAVAGSVIGVVLANRLPERPLELLFAALLVLTAARMARRRGRGEVALRAVAEADVAIFFAHQLDLEARRMAAFTGIDPSDRGAFEARWRRILADDTAVARTILSDGKIVGHIAKYVCEGSAEVTYWVDREHWGRGVASRGLAKFLEQVHERPLYARAAADNRASRRVLEKCGFALCGADRGFANARGEEIDEVVLRLE